MTLKKIQTQGMYNIVYNCYFKVIGNWLNYIFIAFIFYLFYFFSLTYNALMLIIAHQGKMGP